MASMNKIRIATRESALALWQANNVKARLEQEHPGLTCEIVGMTTEGDRDKVSPLSQMGGKGVFIKELETALLDGSADIAVHSMKDVPGELPDGLRIGAICERAAPEDAFVCNHHASLQALPAEARVGSSSLRRVFQIQHAFPALRFEEIRGNVETRLRKLDDGEYDAIVIAVAGLVRLGLGDRVREKIDPALCIPAAGQGAVGVEYNAGNDEVASLLTAVNHQDTATCVHAERTVTRMLEATCNIPIAAYAFLDGNSISLRAFVSSLDGQRAIRREMTGATADSLIVAEALGRQLLEDGAAELISSAPDH